MAEKKIFISYSRRDTDYVSSLVTALREQGFDVWFDKNIRTGTDWDDTIESELKKADAVVLILSKTSVTSDNVKDEISYAIGLNKSVNPIKIEECDVPMRLARKQFVDFTALGHEAGFERLVSDLKRTLEIADEKKEIPKGSFTPPVSKAISANPISEKKPSKLIPYIIGGVAAIVLAVVLMMQFTDIFTPEHKLVEQVPLEVVDIALDGAEDTKSIAVLAFTDMSPEQDQEYFSDGISDEILNLLAKIPELKVISRTSSFSYKGKDLSIKKIGNELHVDHVLEGSIRKSGNTFRITAQLVDVNSATQIWSETYDRDIQDIFKIQDEIATKVTQQLEVSLLGKVLISSTVNTDAYNLFLQARQLKNQRSPESNTNAIKLTRESIVIDSTYAPSWDLLCSLFYQSAFNLAAMPMDEAIKEGKISAKKAIALDPKYVNGYLSLAQLEEASWNFKEGSALMDQAILLEPNSSAVLYMQTYFALMNGKKEVALELMLKRIELDPLNEEWNYFNLALNYYLNGKFVEAEESLNRLLLLHPNADSANSLMGQVQLSLGHPEKALEYIDKDTRTFWLLYRKSMEVYAAGNKKEANVLLKKLIADWGDIAWSNIAHVYAFRGEKNEAFKWLELALENKDITLLEFLSSPEMQNLWGDPRWDKFINKLGLPEDHGFHMDVNVIASTAEQPNE